MKSKIYILICLVFLLADLGYSFVQHMQAPLDGDMAGGIVYSKEVSALFHDPFGFSVITKNADYPNPNRFFAHFFFYESFQIFPKFFRTYVNAADSVYISCALIKTCIQALLLLLIALYSSNGKLKETLTAAVLITPLIQTNGYQSYMGLVDKAITYVFFYGLSSAVLFLYFLPLFKNWISENKSGLSRGTLILLILATPLLLFNGPLNPGVVLIVSTIYAVSQIGIQDLKFRSLGIQIYEQLKRIDKNIFFLFCILVFVSLYSLFISTGNPIFQTEHTTLAERYSRIPFGIYYLLTQKIGMPLLVCLIILNYILIRRTKDARKEKLLTLFHCVGIGILMYIVLLPLGGYKNYRPNILRYDTMIPVTILLFVLYARSAIFLIQNLAGKMQTGYIALLTAVSLLYMSADKPELNRNECERHAFQSLNQSNEKIVLLNEDCSVLSWGIITDPSTTRIKAQAIYELGITSEPKLFYQIKTHPD